LHKASRRARASSDGIQFLPRFAFFSRSKIRLSTASDDDTRYSLTLFTRLVDGRCRTWRDIAHETEKKNPRASHKELHPLNQPSRTTRNAMINIYTSSVVPVSSRVFVLQIAFRCQLSAVGARRGERALNRTLYRYPKEFIRRVESSAIASVTQSQLLTAKM
jgi:hypothetical protein